MENFIKTPFASIGDRDAIPDPIQSTGDVSMTTGYGYDYERDQTSDINAKNIERQKMNWLFYIITQALNEYQSLGVPDFITSALNGGAAYSYKKSAMVRYDGTIYISLVDNNEALPTDNTKWSELIMSNSTSFDGYLKTENLLSEIKDKGTVSQKKSQENIGIEGDIAYRDKDNKFTKPNTFDNYLISNLSLRICAPNDKKLICDISGAYVDLTYKTTFARIRSVSGNLVDGSYHFLVNSPNELILEDTSNKKQYTTYNTGNLTPVLSVNNNKPDANGDVKVSTGTTYSNSASKSTNGWFRDSSTGVIRQWGIGALNTTINFPMAFPTACTSIQVAMLNSDPDDAMSVHDRTSTSFKPYNYWGNSGMSVIWGADGY
ncbi:hypothetical protein GUE31_002442 [Salmonella enterica]|nr:hypothetical protein [Salmonella enterica]